MNKYTIINYFFSYKDKVYWFTTYEEAKDNLQTLLLSNHITTLEPEKYIQHIVTEYEY